MDLRICDFIRPTQLQKKAARSIQPAWLAMDANERAPVSSPSAFVRRGFYRANPFHYFRCR